MSMSTPNRGIASEADRAEQYRYNARPQQLDDNRASATR